MALAGNCMTKADNCPNCGKTMGFCVGLRGLGLRQRGHVDRCKRRGKVDFKSACTVDADAAVPHSLPAQSGDTSRQHKPFVGMEHSATDGLVGPTQPDMDACESETVATEEPSSYYVAHQSFHMKWSSACHDAQQANGMCELEPSIAASEVSQHAFGEQACLGKAVDDSTQTEFIQESLASAAEKTSPAEAAAELCQTCEQDVGQPVGLRFSRCPEGTMLKIGDSDSVPIARVFSVSLVAPREVIIHIAQRGHVGLQFDEDHTAKNFRDEVHRHKADHERRKKDLATNDLLRKHAILPK